jgi:hypothetical protein
METPGIKAATIHHRALSRLECLLLDLIANETQEIAALQSLSRRLAEAAADYPHDSNIAAALEEANALTARHIGIHSLLIIGTQKLQAAKGAAWAWVRQLKGS